MNLISREELKMKLDQGDNLTLVMTLNAWAYQAKHIPGSLHMDSLDHALATLDPEHEIVLYCASALCPASLTAYQLLTAHGYPKVRRYAGGVLDWEDAGYPLEGEMVP